jgi:dTDP-4-amino-4,6-dideoxygalactose transaminase
MGVTSLESLDEFIGVNYRNYKFYQRELQGIAGVELIDYDEKERNNYQYVVLEIDEERAGVGRDRLVEILHAENVIARRYFYPGCHRMEPYRSYFPNADILLPETIRLSNRVICLPSGQSVDREKIATICEIIRMVVDSGAGVRERAEPAVAVA